MLRVSRINDLWLVSSMVQHLAAAPSCASQVSGPGITTSQSKPRCRSRATSSELAVGKWVQMFQADALPVPSESCSLHVDKHRSGYTCCRTVVFVNSRNILQTGESSTHPASWLPSLLGFEKNRKQAPEAFSLSMVTQQSKTGFPSQQQ